MEQPRTVTFGRRAWIALGLFAVLQVGLLAAQVALTTGQLEHIDRQRDVAEAQRETVLDLLAGGREVAGSLEDRLPDLRRGARDAAGLVRESQPLVEDLNRFDTARAVAAAGALAAELTEGGRAVTLIDRANRLLARAADLDNPGDLDRVREISERTLRYQRELLGIQKQTFGVLQESLAVQRETLTHTRSLDRKTGGTLPGG